MSLVDQHPSRPVSIELNGGIFTRMLRPRWRQAIHASAWSGGGFLVSQLLRIGATLLLARTALSPEEFGVMGVVTVLIAGLEMISDLGIGTNVVQHPRGEDPSFLNVAFTLQGLRGLVLWCAVVLVAYPYVMYFGPDGAPRLNLMAMICVASLSSVARGFASASLWTLTRRVLPKQIIILNIIADGAGLLASLAWAWVSPTAWALVIGTVVSGVVYGGGSHFIGGRRDRIAWDSGVARGLIAFGVWVFVSSGTWFLASQAERLFFVRRVGVGGLTTAELGCFTLAVTMAGAPTRAVMQVISQVFFPMISSIHLQDPERAVRQFKRCKWIAAACGACMAVGAVVLGPFTVRFLIHNPEYESVGWMLQFLGVRAGLEVLAGPTSSIIFTYGKPKYAAYGNILRAVVMGAGLWIALWHYGLREALWVLVFTPVAGYIPTLIGVNRCARGVLVTELATLAVVLAAAGAAGLAAGAWIS